YFPSNIACKIGKKGSHGCKDSSYSYPLVSTAVATAPAISSASTMIASGLVHVIDNVVQIVYKRIISRMRRRPISPIAQIRTAPVSTTGILVFLFPVFNDFKLVWAILDIIDHIKVLRIDRPLKIGQGV